MLTVSAATAPGGAGARTGGRDGTRLKACSDFGPPLEGGALWDCRRDERRAPDPCCSIAVTISLCARLSSPCAAGRCYSRLSTINGRTAGRRRRRKPLGCRWRRGRATHSGSGAHDRTWLLAAAAFVCLPIGPWAYTRHAVQLQLQRCCVPQLPLYSTSARSGCADAGVRAQCYRGQIAIVA